MIALSMAAGLSISAIQNLAAATVNDGTVKTDTALKGVVCSPVGGLWLCHTANEPESGGVTGDRDARHAATTR
jgi:hypothetical protein